MDLEVFIEQCDDYLKVVVRGQQSRSDAFEVIDMISAQAVATGLHRVLVDGRDLTNRLEASDIFSIGEQVAKVFGNRLRVALVYRVDFVHGFGESVAVSRGAVFTVRATEQEALSWLMQQ